MLDTQKIIDGYIQQSSWRIKENANASYSYSGMVGHVANFATSDYALSHIYSEEMARAHKDTMMHIHDLSGGMACYCLGMDLEQLLNRGLDDIDGPPKHLTSALSQMMNLVFLVSQEIAGACAFNSVDTLLSPYVYKDKLTYHQIKQAVQEFIYSVNVKGRIGYQCVDKDTEVLTPTGFKKYNEIFTGDHIYTWSNGKLNIQRVKNVSINHHKGKMHVYKGRDYIQQVTDNHRVLRKKYNSHEYELIESSKVFGNKSGLQMPVAFSGLKNDTTIGMSRDMQNLLAFVLTDGTIEASGDRVKIYKSTTRWGNEQIQQTLTNLGFAFRTYEQKTDFGSTIVVYDICARDSRKITAILGNSKKTIPQIFMDMSQEEACNFLDIWARMDGYKGEKDSHIKLQCDSYDIANNLQQLAVIAGFGSRITSRVIGKNKQETIYLILYKNKNKHVSQMYEVDYDDIVWCPSTDDGVVVYRKDGKVFISGNSPFLNVQFDITVPNRKKDTYAVAGNESLDVKYEDLTWERESIVRAFLETIMESKRVLTFPVMNIGITKDFNWDNKLSDVIFECIGKTGQPTINNYVNGDYDPDAVKSMCCSLRLDIKQVLKQVGGQFGAADNSGSIGVVTLNLPLYGYLSGGDKDILYEYVARYMCLAWESLKCKRRFIEDKMQIGFYPTLHRFVEDFRHFFNTIGVVGMNEMLLNMGKPNISDPESKQFCMELLEYMNDVISQFQERDCDFYGTRQGLIGNVELVPAEGISHRLAKHLKQKYPDAITANGTDGEYITRGCWLPADEEYSLMFAAKHQEDLQNLFSGGANFQYHLGEPIYDIKPVKSILRKLITKTKLPFISLSPAIEVCPVCGRVSTLDGWCEHELTEEQIDSLTKQGVELRG